MAGKFVIITAKNGEFTFNLKASNGEVILTASETYTTMDACESGIASVKKNAGAPVEDQTRDETLKHPKYELYKDKAGEYRFRLKAANGQTIAVSEGYTTRSACLNGVESVQRSSVGAEIKEI